MPHDTLAVAHEPHAPGLLRQEFGPIGRRLADRYFGPVRFPESAIEQLRTLGKQGFVVHVMRTTAWVNYLYLHWAMVRHGLPPVRSVVNLRAWFTRPFSLAARSGAFSDRFAFARDRGGSGLIFLKESAFNTARGRATREDPFVDLVTWALKADRPVYLVPELLLWEKWQQKVAPSIFDRIFGSPEAPGFLHSVVTFFRNYKRAQLRVGEPIDLKRFAQEDASQNVVVIARKVRTALGHHLARETRAVFGPPRKPVERLIDEALRDRVLKETIESVVVSRQRSRASVEREARRNFEAIAARYSPTVVGLTAPILNWVFNRIYDGIDVDEAGLERAMKAAAHAPVVIAPSHKSHIDYLIMSYVLWQRGYSVPLVAAGANLSFFPLGPFLRRAGAFFLRRSFKGDPLYTAVFRAYLKKLVHDGIHHEFFPEGGRSRTGKLLHPKLGLFTWLVDAVFEGARHDLLFVPASIDYERVVEGASYTHELRGGEKRAEDLKALLSAPQVLKENYGRIHLTFDEPVSVAALMKERGVSPASATSEEKKTLVRALGHRVMYGINRVSTVTPHALLASALLAHRRRGISSRELTDRIVLLRQIADNMRAPLAKALINGPSSPTTLGPIADAMRMFASEGFVRIVEARGEPIFQVEDDRRAELSFYRNTMLNLVAGRTIVSAALLASEPESQSSTVREQALMLSRLFKFEFLYPVGKDFEHIFDETLEHLVSLGLVVHQGEALRVAAESHARPMVQFLADLIRDYLESYALVAQTLGELPAEGMERKEFVKRTLEVGRASYLAGTLSASEALSRTNIDNALLFLMEREYVVETDKRLQVGPSSAHDLLVVLRRFLPEIV